MELSTFRYPANKQSMKQNANSLCHGRGKKPDKICEICFPKDCKVRVEICITSGIRLSENLGRDVRQFPLLSDSALPSSDKGWLGGNQRITWAWLFSHLWNLVYADLHFTSFRLQCGYQHRRKEIHILAQKAFSCSTSCQ